MKVLPAFPWDNQKVKLGEATASFRIHKRRHIFWEDQSGSREVDKYQFKQFFFQTYGIGIVPYKISIVSRPALWKGFVNTGLAVHCPARYQPPHLPSIASLSVDRMELKKILWGVRSWDNNRLTQYPFVALKWGIGSCTDANATNGFGGWEIWGLTRMCKLGCPIWNRLCVTFCHRGQTNK